MTFQLSDRAKQLIPLARIVNPARLGVSAGSIARIQTADDEGRYLVDEDLASLGADNQNLGQNLESARYLRDNAEAIVTAARGVVLLAYPGIAKPGGDLYPALRAEACWRDFWHFLRCVTYAIASGSPEFTSEPGLTSMNLLYQELKVPLPAMVTGVEALKAESLQRLAQHVGSATAWQANPTQGEVGEQPLGQGLGETLTGEGGAIAAHIAPYFDHLVGKLRSFVQPPTL